MVIVELALRWSEDGAGDELLKAGDLCLGFVDPALDLSKRYRACYVADDVGDYGSLGDFETKDEAKAALIENVYSQLGLR